MPKKLSMAVHKFTSCDGCQLAFINLGEDLLALAELVDIVHFPELGPINPDAKVDVVYVEGSISTPEEEARIKKVRANSTYLITIGACATSGGIQALCNFADKDLWMQGVYAKPAVIATLKTSTAIAKHVKVDLELWGCPVNGRQILDAIKSLLQQTTPTVKRDSVCLECKRKNQVCVMVAFGMPCMGPVTQTGCGALCPSSNRGCYACYGPSDVANTDSLTQAFQSLGLTNDEIQRRFLFIQNQAGKFYAAGEKIKKR